MGEGGEIQKPTTDRAYSSIARRVAGIVRSRLPSKSTSSQAEMDLTRKQVEQDLQLTEAVNRTDYGYLKELLAAYRAREASPSLVKRSPVALQDDYRSEAGRWLETPGFKPVFIDEVLTRLNNPLPEGSQMVVEFLSSQPQKGRGPKNPINRVKVPQLDPRKWHPYEITVRLFSKDDYNLRVLDRGLSSFWRDLGRPIYIPSTRLAMRTDVDWDNRYVNKWGYTDAPNRTIVLGRRPAIDEPVDKPTLRTVIGKPHRWWQLSFGTPSAPTDRPTRITSASTEIDPAIPCGLEDPQLQIVELDLATRKVTVNTYKYPMDTGFLSGEKVERQKAGYDIEGGWLVSSDRKTEPLVFDEFAKRWFTLPIRDFTS